MCITQLRFLSLFLANRREHYTVPGLVEASQTRYHKSVECLINFWLMCESTGMDVNFVCVASMNGHSSLLFPVFRNHHPHSLHAGVDLLLLCFEKSVYSSLGHYKFSDLPTVLQMRNGSALYGVLLLVPW